MHDLGQLKKNFKSLKNNNKKTYVRIIVGAETVDTVSFLP